MHQLSRIAFDVPVLTAAQNGRRSAESSPKVRGARVGVGEHVGDDPRRLRAW